MIGIGRIVSALFPVKLLKALEHQAEKEKTSISNVLRRAVKKYIAEKNISA